MRRVGIWGPEKGGAGLIRVYDLEFRHDLGGISGHVM